MGDVSIDLEKLTINNKNYRKVINTTKQIQLVLMSLLPGQDIGFEIHPHTTQFIKVEKGDGVAIINGVATPLYPGSSIIISQGKEHNIINTGNTRLQLYTIYSPPEHDPHLIQFSKI